MSGENQVDFLAMSDDALLALDPNTLSATTLPATEEQATSTADVTAEADEAQGAAGAEVPAGGADAEGTDAGEGTESHSDPLASDADAATKTPVDPKTESQPAQTPADAIDYKAAYERLTAPFKANGRDMAVTSVDDAIALMQMGANYNKKMAALKPNLKLLKMLENNGLLSEEKLSYLIDLDQKNPEAINKLVKDSGLDPLDLSADKASAYKPKTYAVDDREIELDTVLDELQGSKAYTRTLDIVSNKWDGASKQTIAQTPQLLRVLNDHVDRGIYDLIVEEVERERVFGRLKGLSDLEAYRQVGDAIQQRGGFNHLGAPSGTPAAKTVVAPKPKQVDDDKLKDKRRAASSTKPASAPAAAKADFNPLALSDEEFAKVGIHKFI